MTTEADQSRDKSIKKKTKQKTYFLNSSYVCVPSD